MINYITYQLQPFEEWPGAPTGKDVGTMGKSSAVMGQQVHSHPITEWRSLCHSAQALALVFALYLHFKQTSNMRTQKLESWPEALCLAMPVYPSNYTVTHILAQNLLSLWFPQFIKIFLRDAVGCSPVVEHLPSTSSALDLIPNTENKNKIKQNIFLKYPLQNLTPKQNYVWEGQTQNWPLHLPSSLSWFSPIDTWD